MYTFTLMTTPLTLCVWLKWHVSVPQDYCVAVIYLQMPQPQSVSSHIYHITSQSTFLPASVTVENHVMPQLQAHNYGSMVVQQDGAPPISCTEICVHLSAVGMNWT